MSPELFRPHLALPPTESLLWVLVFGGLVTMAWGIALRQHLLYRGRSLRAEAADRRAGPPPLEMGPALLHGHVETMDGQPAVRIEIEQHGTEQQSKGSWRHSWVETGRSIQVRPFRLRLKGDEVVTVMPDERVRLVDNLATETFVDDRRWRVAEVVEREKVWVSGVLAREGPQAGASSAYRSGPSSWVLRGTAAEPLEVSSGTLARQFQYWRSFYRRAALVLTVAWLAVQGALFAPYYLLLFTGKVATAEVTTTSTYTTTSRRGRTIHYVLHARLPAKEGGHEVKDEVEYYLYQEAEAGRLKRAPFVWSPALPVVHTIGRRAVLWFWPSVLSLLISGLGALWLVVSWLRARPWYEQRKVVERGEGPLNASAWKIQVASAAGQYIDGEPR